MNKINVNLDSLAEGAVGEKFNNALKEVTKIFWIQTQRLLLREQ